MSEALRRSRCNDRQKNCLVDFMVANRELAPGTPNQYFQWVKLAEELANIGPRKTVEQWKITWRDLKSKAKIANAERALALEHQMDNPTHHVPTLSELNDKILGIIGRTTSEGLLGIPESPISGVQPNSLLEEVVFEIEEENIQPQASQQSMPHIGGVSRVAVSNATTYHQSLGRLSEDTHEGNSAVHEDEGREPESKKPRQDNFTIVKKCCVNLVKNHGRSVTLFDDLAFRELMDLIPMTRSEKQTLTSEYIQRLLDDDQLADQTDMETINRTTDDIAADDDDQNSLLAIKEEVEVTLCTCGKDSDEGMSRHNVECPASSQQTYWKFFEIFLDSATCQICDKTLTWTDIATLKEHLLSSHPSVDFVEKDEELQKGPPSEDGSTNVGMVEEYLDEAVSESEQTASAAKRRRKRAKAALHITGPITRENIAASLQRFESLDSFGQYVASLMKLIPKDKCIKFQIQMVEQLLQEQAAAG